MKALVAIVLLAALLGPAIAQEIVVERHLLSENDLRCRRAGVDAHYIMEACSIVTDAGCRIIFPEGNASDPYLTDLMAHELFHCRQPFYKHRRPRN